MKNIKYILFLSVILSLSCSKDQLDEIDTDPNNPTSVPVEYILPSAEVKMFHSFFGGSTATAISTYVEHTCNVHPEKMDIVRKTGIWHTGYAILKDCKLIIEQASEQDFWTHVGIAQVVQAITLATMTEIFGDIPWTEALLGSDNRSPKFDSQESIYNEVFKMLDEAIVNLSKATVKNPGDYDLLLKGDTDMWKKVAWGLKARYLNRLSNIDPSGSASDVLAAVSNSFTSPGQGLIFSEYQEATVYSNAFTYEEIQWSRFAASKTIADMLKSLNDPRAEIWFNKIDGEIIGAPNGENNTDLGHSIYSGVSRENVLYLSADMPIITYSETKFIEAEANFRLGNLPDANSAYQEAVIAACSRTGLTTDEINSYTSQSNVFPDNANLTLEMIMKQKYLSFFMMQPIEAFNDYRRTLIPYPLYNTVDGIPHRIIYPEEELARNVNAPTDIDLVTIYTKKLWWAK